MSKFMFYTTGEHPEELDIYNQSVQTAGNDIVFRVNAGSCDKLVITSDGKYRVLDLDHDCADYLRRTFPFSAPSKVLRHAKTIGTGDRLGVACDGHIASVEGSDFYPVLAQQSIRELTLTGRSYEAVLDAVTFAVFKNGFKTPWGADGDHLKTDAEIEYAISCGYTMITLDSSEKIKTGVERLSDAELAAIYTPNSELENIYPGHEFHISSDVTVSFDERTFREAAVIYGEAIDFISEIYSRHIRGAELDFEISIDETATPTTPEQHFFVANELARRGVKFDTMAPRFCGEFQKGIDYIGDLTQFEREFIVHAAIADKFDYKISVHSGSDKFSVFPLVGKLSHGRFHLKTAGTSWLEAMKLIAKCEPELYREVHAYALSRFEDAKKYYVVTTDLSKIPALDTLSDAELPQLFDNNDARQLIHITYGFILGAKDEQENFVYRDRLYAAWRRHADEYRDLLAAHIGRHISALDSLI